MTTLPPEPNDGDSAAQQPGAPVPPPAAPVPPTAPPVPPTAPPTAPPVPPQPQFQQPQQGYQQPQYAAPASDPSSLVTLNLWLSVFFGWLPALIFYFVEKGKNQLADQYHRENLNFALVRLIPVVGIWIFGMIPYIGWLLAVLLWLCSVVLFVFHIIAAVKGTENFKRGIPLKFIFNIQFVK